MKIPVKFFKNLNKPAESAEPNSFYLVKPDADTPLNLYVTDIDGNVEDVFAKRSVASILLASEPVDFNTGTGKQVLYTVPADERTIVTAWDLDFLSGVPTNAAFKSGWNLAADDVFSDAIAVQDLIDSTSKYGSLLTAQSRLVGVSGQSLGITVTTPEGSALTARMNIFGYRTNTDGIPIPNVL